MKPKYKVGDIVTVKRVREGSKNDYRFCFTDPMVEEHGGKSYKIKDVSDRSYAKEGSIPDDGYGYELEGNSYVWASSMFEDSSDALSLDISTDNSLDAFIAKKKCPELDFTL